MNRVDSNHDSHILLKRSRGGEVGREQEYEGKVNASLEYAVECMESAVLILVKNK